MPAPADFASWDRADQLAYLYRTYGGTIEDRQRAAGGNNALTSARFRANNVATGAYVSPEERALWSQVKPDDGTWLGNALSSVAPYALAAGLAYAGGTALMGNGAGAESNLGIFANGGANGLAGVGAGNAGALAASGSIAGGAGIAGTTAGALGGLSRLANGISGVGGNMGWSDWIGPAITVAGSLVGTRQANDATTAASRAAIGEQQRQFDLVRSDTAPQRALGASAVNTLSRYYGFNTGPNGTAGAPDTSVFTNSPDYQFNLAEGQRAVNNSLAASGGALSGAGVKAGIRYASGMASREHAGFVDRLMQAAGLGNTGIAASANAGANAANNIGAYNVNAGNSRANAYMNNAANISNAVNTGYSNTLLRRYLGEGG